MTRKKHPIIDPITVFLSGSRSIQELHPLVQQRLRNILAKNFRVVIGDADGVDTAFQNFFWEHRYPQVVVYCPGARCRNNVGGWPQHHIDVPPHIRGRAFYTQRDKAMAAAADVGFVVWDGKSKGSQANIEEMKRLGKPSLVFHHGAGRFEVIRAGH
ncbi:MAG: hypothetical protein QNK37_37225 [Acidobacteriota bacterium]|nr:hypothetical protein [Acidobacteriota bacterium]